MRSNRMIILGGVVAMLFLAQMAMALPQTVTFASTPGAWIQFIGNNGTSSTFSFPPNGSGASDFQIGSEANFNSSGNVVGLFGEIQGNFSFDAANITTVGATEVAPVTGTGTFVIHDGANDLTATLVWDNIQTRFTAGGTNSTGQVNLSNFSYGGSNLQLQELATDGAGVVSVSFGFVPAQDLKYLASANCGAGCSSTFSGAFTAAPEASLGGFLLVGMLAVLGIVRRYRTA